MIFRLLEFMGSMVFLSSRLYPFWANWVLRNQIDLVKKHLKWKIEVAEWFEIVANLSLVSKITIFRTKKFYSKFVISVVCVDQIEMNFPKEVLKTHFLSTKRSKTNRSEKANKVILGRFARCWHWCDNVRRHPVPHTHKIFTKQTSFSNPY